MTKQGHPTGGWTMMLGLAEVAVVDDPVPADLDHRDTRDAHRAAAAVAVGAGPLGEHGLVAADLALDGQLDRAPDRVHRRQVVADLVPAAVGDVVRLVVDGIGRVQRRGGVRVGPGVRLAERFEDLGRAGHGWYDLLSCHVAAKRTAGGSMSGCDRAIRCWRRSTRRRWPRPWPATTRPCWSTSAASRSGRSRPSSRRCTLAWTA